MSTEAMKLALGALEAITVDVKSTPTAYEAQRQAINALREALAEQPAQQEPVATEWERIARAQNAKLMAMCNQPGGMDKLREVLLAASPQAQPKREWVGLTDEERFLNDFRSSAELEYAKAIEAKLKEKNHG